MNEVSSKKVKKIVLAGKNADKNANSDTESASSFDHEIFQNVPIYAPGLVGSKISSKTRSRVWNPQNSDLSRGASSMSPKTAELKN